MPILPDGFHKAGDMRTKQTLILLAICLMALPLTWLYAGAQTSASITMTPNTTPTITPTIHRAPCHGEATRTPTQIPTRAPTLAPTPTYTPTSQSARLTIPLHYPPNCAVLRSNTLPDFAFDAPRGPFISTVIIWSPENNVYLQLVDYPNREVTPVPLADGKYFWWVSVSRQSGSGGVSETWEFQINTRCNCADTPTPIP
jgi:hypothetical protein